ncbi:LCP family protein [Catenulispora pinisilvae]|uniref:LCP family protein n=1 Tax=Catenulispora pinisilvae TaxID=2705253 RepID=UPI001891D050|nr:LCP family protein [Catenulispora pinisilvae]
MSMSVLLISVTGAWLRAAVDGGFQRSAALGGTIPKSHDGSVNILLMGLDSRKDNQGHDLPAAMLDKLHAGSSSDIGGYNTNTLILLHVPADGSPATAVSIPRDDWVDIPNLGWHKIKEAYGRAKAAQETTLVKTPGGPTGDALEAAGREAGRASAIAAVQSLLNLPIDHFAEVNLAGFYDVAVALGGVTVCLNKAVQDDYSGADFPAGVQTLDGSKALAFVRQRHGLPGGDLDRTRRQQAFLSAVQRKLSDDGVLSDVGKLSDLIDAVKRDVVVDNSFDVLSLVSKAGSLKAGRIQFHTLPIEGFATRDGQDVNMVDPVKIQAAMKTYFSDAKSGTAGDAGSGSGTGAGTTSDSGTDTSSDTGADSQQDSVARAGLAAAPKQQQSDTTTKDGIACVN